MLEIPVGIFPTSFGRLLVVSGGEQYFIDFPCDPYEYREAAQGDHSELVHLIGGGDSFIEKCSLGRSIPTKISSDGLKKIPIVDYVLDLVKDHEDFLRSILNTSKDPYPLSLDIETSATDEHFSKAERDQIISIQLKYPDCKGEIFHISSQTSEKQMLADAISYMALSPTGKRPDICVGYFLNKFDIPYIKKRVALAGLSALWKEKLSFAVLDPKEEIYYPQWISYNRTKAKHDRKESFDLCNGICTLDLYLHAKSDLILKDLPSRSMKNVANFYGSKTVVDLPPELKRNMQDLLFRDKDRFMSYAYSDLEQTEYLYDVYIKRLIASSNLLACPLTMVHRMSSGQKSYIALYRDCRKNRYYALKKNKDRYAHLYARAPKYQGALVDCFKKGYFPNTIYVDCASMYPNIMHDFNLSYDRYRLLEVVDYVDWALSRGFQVPDVSGDENRPPIEKLCGSKPSLTAEGPPEKKVFYIPDDNYQALLKIEIDLVDDGFIRKLINRMNAERKGFRKLKKEADESGNKTLSDTYDSMQQEVKVLVNTIYGIQGNVHYEIADLPAAIFVTAVGRWIMQQMIELFGDAVIEIDTDGVLLDRNLFDMGIEEINKYLRDKIHTIFGVPYDKMNFLLEFEGAGSVYMYKRKNYILKEKGKEKWKTKGSAFTGYDKAPVIQRAVQIMAEAVMNPSQSDYLEARDRATDIEPLLANRESFKFTKVVKRSPENYKGYKSVHVFTRSIDRTLPSSEVLKLMKEKSLAWAQHVYGKNKDTFKQVKQRINQCTTVARLEAMLSLLGSLKGDKTDSTHYMLDLILRMIESGYEVEEDDVLEYYYTLSAEKYTLAHEIDQNTILDMRRYLKDISKVIDRFEYANPLRRELSLDSFFQDNTVQESEDEDEDGEDEELDTDPCTSDTESCA